MMYGLAQIRELNAGRPQRSVDLGMPIEYEINWRIKRGMGVNAYQAKWMQERIRLLENEVRNLLERNQSR